jgi:NTE family protein
VSKLNQVFNAVSAFTRELSRPRDNATASLPHRPKIGLAFGGGFARGIAHIGVLKVFEAEGIPIDYIAGTSVGAVVGAFYCSGVSVKELEEIAAIMKFNQFARFSLSRMGFWSNDRLGNMLNRMLKVHTFEELSIPLAVTATDFVSGAPVVFTKGSLIDPVRASCAYPSFFQPVNIDGRLMIDGLLAHPVPATPLKQMGADKVCAVYFNSHWVGATGPRHFMDIIGQCFSIAQANVCPLWQANADIVLEPKVEGFAYDAFHKATDLVKAGEDAALEAVPKIKSWLEFLPAPQPKAKPSLTPRTLPITG